MELSIQVGINSRVISHFRNKTNTTRFPNKLKAKRKDFKLFI
jgi:hypothetical protein